MNHPFFRFPHTPHLIWLGTGTPREDKVLPEQEAKAFFDRPVYVEEKLDGANTGISFDENGTLLVQNRGGYLSEPWLGQYAKLGSWIKPRVDSLFDLLADRFILFGEWCFAKHSLAYSNLPDWFLAFDLYDRAEHRFMARRQRNAVAEMANIPLVPELGYGKYPELVLKELVLNENSRYRSGPLEGIVLRVEMDDRTTARAKIVRPDFVQTIETHWHHQGVIANQRVLWGVAGQRPAEGVAE